MKRPAIIVRLTLLLATMLALLLGWVEVTTITTAALARVQSRVNFEGRQAHERLQKRFKELREANKRFTQLKWYFQSQSLLPFPRLKGPTVVEIPPLYYRLANNSASAH